MNYKEFVDSIKKKEIKNVYLFAGEEVFLIDDALERLKSTVLNAGFQELNFTILDGKEVSHKNKRIPVICDQKKKEE